MAVVITPSWGVVAPQPPLQPVGTRGDSQVSVAVGVAYDGGSPVTSYTVTASPGGASASGSTSPIVVTGLTNGTAYTFTATATNAHGTSAPSVASAAVTPGVTGNVTVQIAAAADTTMIGGVADAGTNSRTPNTNSGSPSQGATDGSPQTVLSIGEHSAGNNCWIGGLLFRNITIPNGVSAITSATLTVYAGGPYNATGTTPGHYITYWLSAQLADSAPSLALTASDLMSTARPRSTNTVAFDYSNNAPLTNTAGEAVSVDITAVVNEIITRPGWASGNNICILVDVKGAPNTGVGNTAPSEWNDFQTYTVSQAATAPKLNIVY